MKKCAVFIALFFYCSTFVYSQKIQYSRHTFQTPYTDAVQLVANVGGYHHLLCFTADKMPLIYIFDAALQGLQTVAVDARLNEASDIRIISFSNYYLLYIHTPGSSKHVLWKIGGDGTTSSLSIAFQALIDSVFNKSKATLQLLNQNGQLFLVSHTYFDGIKNVSSTIAQVNDLLEPVSVKKVLYPFNKTAETLLQTSLAGNNLFVLKSVVEEEKGNSIEILKIDIDTGKYLANSFNSASYLYTTPSFVVSKIDSSILLSSLIREPPTNLRAQRTVFICRLDHLLKEKAPVTLLRSQFRNSTAVNFLFVDGAQPACFAMNNSVRIRRTNTRMNGEQSFEEDDFAALNLARTSSRYLDYLPEYNQPQGVRFTMLNEHFGLVKDSLVANKKNLNDIQPRPYAQFTMNNKSNLVLIQNFTSKHKGLVVVNHDANGTITNTPLPVYERYEYQLEQLQAVGDEYIIIPYTYKGETGLVKIKMV